MRLTLHARIEIGLTAILLLGSCGGPSLSENQRAEVTSIADDAAGDGGVDPNEFATLQRQVSEQDSEIASLKRTVSDNAEAFNSLKTLYNQNVDTANAHYARLARIEQRLGM